MDEVLKLKRSLEKSEAICDAHNYSLVQKRKDMDALERKLFENEKRVTNIFNEKLDLQTRFDELKETVKIQKYDIKTKNEEIEKLKDEMADRTQKLQNEKHALTQKLEQREIIQHSYKRSSVPSMSMSSGFSLIFPQKVKASTAHHLGASSGSFYDNELLINSNTMNAADDAMKAEQSLMAQADYLKKMATERSKNRNLSARNNTKRQARLALRFKEKKLQTADTLAAEKKLIEKRIKEKEKKLDNLRNTAMPEDKAQRMDILLEIATADDDLLKLKRKLKSVKNRIKKSKVKDANSPDTPDLVDNQSPMSKLTTADALGYIEAALSMSELKDTSDNDDF